MADKKAAGGKAGGKAGAKGAGKGGKEAKPANKGAGAAKAAGSGSKAQKKAGQPRQAQDFTKRDHAGAGLEAVAPRLKTYYDSTVKAALAKLVRLHSMR